MEYSIAVKFLCHPHRCKGVEGSWFYPSHSIPVFGQLQCSSPDRVSGMLTGRFCTHQASIVVFYYLDTKSLRSIVWVWTEGGWNDDGVLHRNSLAIEGFRHHLLRYHFQNSPHVEATELDVVISRQDRGCTYIRADVSWAKIPRQPTVIVAPILLLGFRLSWLWQFSLAQTVRVWGTDNLLLVNSLYSQCLFFRTRTKSLAGEARTLRPGCPQLVQPETRIVKAGLVDGRHGWVPRKWYWSLPWFVRPRQE